ncbi:Reverse transcriptase zinc-binding domain [Arabidopsis suecica]|uniref:Reverse transcriptase zinc-binding domain n=1 Tax=Arabidopsis suecica TaxID=45249 RepID=A0A8T2B0I3_ARASU|nr:Reverse transcriptase zinc-binding domain [Arabidopsis suecica]KAG7580368.1 Reverse transcriptase zinc-binding domain [Arabidopsis suecica]
MRLGIPQSSTLAELWENGNWIMPPARSDAQVRIQTYLSTLSLSETQDSYEWWPNNQKSDKFCTSVIYYLLKDHKPQVTWSREVWFSGGIPKHKFLTWLMVLDRSPTRDRLLNWGLATDPSCLLCSTSPESRSHLFFDCSFSGAIWVFLSSKCNYLSSRSWDTLLSQLSSYSVSKPSRKLLLIAWQASIYCIWSERNNRLHRNAFKSIDTLIRDADLIIRNRIASIRLTNPRQSSQMLQIWLS